MHSSAETATSSYHRDVCAAVVLMKHPLEISHTRTWMPLTSVTDSLRVDRTIVAGRWMSWDVGLNHGIDMCHSHTYTSALVWMRPRHTPPATSQRQLMSGFDWC